MARTAAVLCGMTALFLTTPLSADQSHFVTTFRFEARFSDGPQTYNENQHVSVSVWLPPDMKWQCERPPPGIVDGRRRGSFACSNDGWKTSVLTMVGCTLDAPDPLRVAAMRIFGPGRPSSLSILEGDAGAPTSGKFVDLAVSCETVRVR
jgi:hypothetical protein